MTLEFFRRVYHRQYTAVMRIGEKFLESSENTFMNLPLYVFDVDNVAKKNRSELSITVLVNKINKISA